MQEARPAQDGRPETRRDPLNRLAAETSPYLRQHAENPVDWYPWGDEALKRAKDLDRPIFLSIGYSSCHWCHVMERESFEDPEIARILNDRFVSIKVDREERPDVDAIYMSAVQMLTGSGGWPLSVFLTPDLKPFWGGTYFPPQRRFGRPGFDEILLRLAEAYGSERERLEGAADELLGYLRQEDALAGGAEGPQDVRAAEGVDGAAGAEAARGLPGDGPIRDAVQHARQTFDAHHGGFGPAPKFPRAIEISTLLREHHQSGDPQVLLMCEKTLEAMAQGGMYDQIGGGFHRYSTDARWLVPHFEKMLYDNALLARTYTEAYQATKKSLNERIAREILDYVLREMTSPEGGFYSATDADSEGEEGRFFVWTPEEVEDALADPTVWQEAARADGTSAKAAARLLCEYWGITPGGNFEGRTSIPHVTRTLADVARSLGMDPEEAGRILERGRAALYRRRESRTKPFRDEKILTAWNGLMIAAFARAYQAFDEPRYLEAARRAASLILGKLRVGGRLLRTYAEGVAKTPAYLDDHANLAGALLDLYECDFDLAHLRAAAEVADALLERFWDREGGGFFSTSSDHDHLIVRKRDLLDGSTPSGSGAAALALLRLERLTGRAAYRERVEEFFRRVKGPLERIPAAFGITLIALDWLLRPPVEVAIVGDIAGPDGQGLLRVARRAFLPRRVIAAAAAADGAPVGEEAARAIPLLSGKSTLDGKTAAYVCRDSACKAPVTSPEALAAALRVGR